MTELYTEHCDTDGHAPVLERPEAVIHCDDEGVQRIQFGRAEEHLATDDPENLGDWQ